MQSNTNEQERNELEEYLRSFHPHDPNIELNQFQAESQSVSLTSSNSLANTAWKWWQVVAASWLCGALIGAAVMFIVTRQVPTSMATKQPTPVVDLVKDPSPNSEIQITASNLSTEQSVIEKPSTQILKSSQSIQNEFAILDPLEQSGASSVFSLRTYVRSNTAGNAILGITSTDSEPSIHHSNSDVSRIIRGISVPQTGQSTTRSLTDELITATSNS